MKPLLPKETWLTKDCEGRITSCCDGTDELMQTSAVGLRDRDIFTAEQLAPVVARDKAFREKGSAYVHRQNFNTVALGWRVFDSIREAGPGGDVKLLSYDITTIVDPHNYLQDFDYDKKCFRFKPSQTSPEITMSRERFTIVNRHLRGWSNQQIADLLHKSVKTVEYHLRDARRLAKRPGRDLTLHESIEACGLLHIIKTDADWFD